MTDTTTGNAEEHEEAQRYEKFEEKEDQLADGLLTAFAAGYAQAVEDQAVEGHDLPRDVGGMDYRDLKNHEYIQKQHFYFWDGRTVPLAFWLPDQFDLDGEEAMP